MEKRELKIGDVVQITQCDNDGYIGLFVIVIEPKDFGAMGYIASPFDMPLTRFDGLAYLRVNWEEIEYVGFAPLILQSKPSDDEDN